ncbi:MAG: hypothetical protein AB7H43_08045 [Acidimicrobiia bacterium]
MDINAIALTFLEIPAELTQEYNRWYDLDHMPEHVSKDDVVMGRRYVATRAHREAPGALADEDFGNFAPYATIYFHGGPLDFTSDEARELWRVMDHRIVRQGRYWKDGRALGGGRWWLAEGTARPGVLVAPPAIPHLNHRGVIFAYGRAPSVERRDAAVAWWRDTHLPDLFTVPGVFAALRFDPVPGDPGGDDRLLHVILCDEPPIEVMGRIEESKRYTRAIGRFPAHGGAYEPLAFLPYDRIVPFEYDFEF